MVKLKLSIRQRLQIKLTGAAYLDHRTRLGWRDNLPFYAFRCPTHGLVVTYPQGYRQILMCPKCMEALNAR